MMKINLVTSYPYDLFNQLQCQWALLELVISHFGLLHDHYHVFQQLDEVLGSQFFQQKTPLKVEDESLYDRHLIQFHNHMVIMG